MKKDDVLGGRYKLLKHLGSGGLAVVWQATDLRDQKLVAVKCLRTKNDLLESLDEDEAHDELRRMRGRFRREGALLGRLRNRSIPELYDQGTHGSEPYLVMRFVAGKPMHRFLDQYTPTIEVAAAIGVQIAEALTFSQRRSFPDSVEDECGAGYVADAAGAEGDMLECAPAFLEFGGGAFAEGS